MLFLLVVKNLLLSTYVSHVAWQRSIRYSVISYLLLVKSWWYYKFEVFHFTSLTYESLAQSIKALKFTFLELMRLQLEPEEKCCSWLQAWNRIFFLLLLIFLFLNKKCVSLQSIFRNSNKNEKRYPPIRLQTSCLQRYV